MAGIRPTFDFPVDRTDVWSAAVAELRRKLWERNHREREHIRKRPCASATLAAMSQAPKLVQAMRHPPRVAILRALSQRRMTASDLATELDVPVGHLTYHARQLHGLGLLIEDGAEIRNGPIERAYVLDADALDEG